MKKLSKIFGTILLSAALILSLAACGSSTDTKESGKTGDEPAKQQESVTENPVKEDAKEDSQKPSEAGTEEQVTDDTAAGSGLSGFDSKLSSACPDSTVGEGLQIMRYLGRNMAWLLRLKEAGINHGIEFPKQEESRMSTNFIR